MWGNVLRSVIGKTERGGGVRSNIYRLHLDLVVKELYYNVPLSEIKSYVVVMSFYIKMMKRRTLQACSLRHSIKKGKFSV